MKGEKVIRQLPDGTVETLSFRMQDQNGREVLLIGTVHIAKQAFFDRIQALIDQDPEAIILAEAKTETEYPVFGEFIAKCGLASQRNTLQYPKDMTVEEGISLRDLIEEIIASIGLKWLLDIIEDEFRISSKLREEMKNMGIEAREYLAQEEAEDAKTQAETKKTYRALGMFVEKLISRGVKNGFHTPKWLRKAPIIKQIYNALIENRNRDLVTFTELTKPGTKIIAPWGAGHVEGIADRLEANNWRKVDGSNEYIECMKEPKWKDVLQALKEISK